MRGAVGVAEDRALAARALGFTYAAGATVGATTLLLPHDPRVDDTAILVLVALALTGGAALAAGARRVRAWTLHAALVVAALILTAAIIATDFLGVYTIIYAWPALYGFAFLPLRAALVHGSLMTALYAAALVVLSDVPDVANRVVILGGTLLVVGLVVSQLLARVRGSAREAAASEDRARLLIETTAAPFVSVDADGRIVDWNPAATRLLGWSAAAAVGRRLGELVLLPEERPRHDERRRALLSAPAEQGARARLEVTLRRRDGTQLPAEVVLSTMRRGDQWLLSAFIADLSEARRREAERTALAREQAARAAAERQAATLAGLERVVDAALTHLTLRDRLDDVAARVRELLGADAVGVLVSEEDGLVLRAASGEEPPGAEGIAARVAAERGTVRQGGAVGVPLMAGEHFIGVLAAATHPSRALPPEAPVLLRLAADRIAVTVEAARVFEREHRIAERLQRSLLPARLPAVPGVDIAARYRPAAAEADVGGDWYDALALPGGRVVLALGDVFGKGLEAATVVGTLRSALRALALEGHGPAAMLERLNRLLATDDDHERLATLAVVDLDPLGGALCWAAAGHPPPLVTGGCPETAGARFLEGGRSLPLGVRPFAAFREASGTLRPGERLLLYSDGLVERRGHSIDDGLAALAVAVTAAPAGADALCHHALASLGAADGDARDDVALLALEYVAVGARLRTEVPAEPSALAPLRGLLRRWLTEAGAAEDDVFAVVQACGEVCIAAIERGEGGALAVEGEVRDGEVSLDVRGAGGPTRRRTGESPAAGRVLLEAQTDAVEVHAEGAGTTVRLRRRLAVSSPPPVPPAARR